MLRTYAASPYVDDHAPSGMSVKTAFDIKHEGITGAGGSKDVSNAPIPATADRITFGDSFKYTNLAPGMEAAAHAKALNGIDPGYAENLPRDDDGNPIVPKELEERWGSRDPYGNDQWSANTLIVDKDGKATMTNDLVKIKAFVHPELAARDAALANAGGGVFHSIFSGVKHFVGLGGDSPVLNKPELSDFDKYGNAPDFAFKKELLPPLPEEGKPTLIDRVFPSNDIE